jgi:hypothetical protein
MQTRQSMSLLDIQPSQLYISAPKLRQVQAWLRLDDMGCFEPVPIKELNGKIIFTDGHTRAFALYKLGANDIPVYWDTDDLDWEAYQICVDWCIAAGIRSVADLENRIIGAKLYVQLWHRRCAAMQAELAQQRRQTQSSKK